MVLLKKNINVMISIILGVLIIVILLCYDAGASDTYAIKSEKQSNGCYYKYVTEKNISCTYLGNNQFIDYNGKVWKYDVNNNYKKGHQYTLKYHNNGTKANNDDIIISIY